MDIEEILSELYLRIEVMRERRDKPKYSRSRIPEPGEKDTWADFEEQFKDILAKPADEPVEQQPKPSFLQNCINEIKERLREKFKKPEPPAYLKELFKILNERNMTNAEFYKKAHIDRRHFSKICSNYDYRPSCKTVYLMCLALEFSLDEAKHFLSLFGYCIWDDNETDIIVSYLLEKGIYDIDLCNEILIKFGEKPLEKTAC